MRNRYRLVRVIIYAAIIGAGMLALTVKLLPRRDEFPERVFVPPSKCTVAAALWDDFGDRIYIKKAGRSRQLGYKLSDLAISRLLGYDKKTRSLLMAYRSAEQAVDEDQLLIGWYDGKRILPLNLNGVNPDAIDVDLASFQSGKIVVPVTMDRIPAAKIFSPNGRLERSIIFRLPPQLRSFILRKVLLLRNGAYAILLDSDNLPSIIALCDSQGRSFRTLGKGCSDVTYDTDHHRLVFRDYTKESSINVIDLKNGDQQTIATSEPAPAIQLTTHEELNSVSVAPGGEWVLASFTLYDGIGVDDGPLYAISIDRDLRKQRWCKLKDAIDPERWIPVDSSFWPDKDVH